MQQTANPQPVFVMKLPASKDDFVQELHRGLDQTSRQIDELKLKAKLGEAEARDALERRAEQLETQQRKLKEQLDELQQSGAEASSTLMDGAGRAWDSLRSSLDDAYRQFSSK